MEIRFTAKAAKELKRISPPQGTILAKIKQYTADPDNLANNIKALKGSDEFRLRVGDHRILFIILEDGSITIMQVTAVRHRSNAYE